MAGKRQITVTIAKDGKATILVNGVAGPDCLELTKFLEEALAAQGVEREKTSEYYQPAKERVKVRVGVEEEETHVTATTTTRKRNVEAPPSLNLAVRSYETFTSKKPQRIEPLPSSIKFPRELGYAGKATEINYCSDKWYEDKTVLYYHPTESHVGTYFPWDTYEWLKPVEDGPPPKWPSELWMLGLAWGFTFQRHDTREHLTCNWKIESAREISWKEARKRDVPVLAGSPDTHMLCIIHPKDGVLVVFFGGDLRVTERGIEG